MTSSLWVVWGNKSTGTAYLGIKGTVSLALADLMFFEPSFTKFSIANPSGLQVTYSNFWIASHFRMVRITLGWESTQGSQSVPYVWWRACLKGMS
ncbi:hypothetical protein E2C01_028594 [Portunus trituberculatus]|uniref:Uncharacterized protein n=1 Tax=Portunus trituberculatus TaxID=210409 RepID=A0A5B7EPI2_PORTR|nr:hypothetical protein [Portunus trituberculatus]